VTPLSSSPSTEITGEDPGHLLRREKPCPVALGTPAPWDICRLAVLWVMVKRARATNACGQLDEWREEEEEILGFCHAT